MQSRGFMKLLESTVPFSPVRSSGAVPFLKYIKDVLRVALEAIFPVLLSMGSLMSCNPSGGVNSLCLRPSSAARM